MPNLDGYKTEHLFLLIGENPLPNYVAAKLLAKTPQKENINKYNNGKPVLHLVCSSDTEKYATNLRKTLGEVEYSYCDGFIQVNPSDFDEIQGKLRDRIGKIGDNASIGLHYTGGTKAMSVHAYRAIETLTQNTKFSYLDARNLEIRFDEKIGNDQVTFKIAHFQDERDSNVKIAIKKRFDRSSISLENLLKLHGLNLLNQPRKNSLISKTDLNKLLISALKNDANWSDFKKRMVANKSLNITLPDNSTLDMANLPNNISAKELCQDYLAKAKWFEDYVLEKVLEAKNKCDLGDCVSNFETEHPTRTGLKYFEIDVVLMRGYQFFAISCSLDSNKDNCKKKLFEIAHRAKQIGGSEARICLVCLVEETDKHNLMHQLERENILVLGKKDLIYLTEWLEDWFNAKK